MKVVPMRRILAVLLCLGAYLTLLSLPASAPDGPSTLGMANGLHIDQAPNANAPPLDGNYPSAPAEETKKTDQDPVNADLLTMLLLAASFFGLSVGWLLSNAQGQEASCFPSLGVVGEVLGSTREDYLPFLGVLRL